jgi:hypothetical protein
MARKKSATSARATQRPDTGKNRDKGMVLRDSSAGADTARFVREPAGVWVGTPATDLDLTASAPSRVEMLAAGLDAFWALADRWALTAEEQNDLLNVSDSTRLRWRAGRVPAPDPDLLDRLRMIVLIYQRLMEIAGTDRDAAAVLRRAGSAADPRNTEASLLDAMRASSLLGLLQIERSLFALAGAA